MNERDFKRFNTKYEIQEGDDACWLWTHYLMKNGYATMSIGGRQGSKLLVHRLSLYHHTQDTESFNNQLILARHSCRNRHCVNPQHLSWGTHKDNNGIDKVRDGTDGKGDRHSQNKLTETQVREIRTRTDKLQKDLAIEYGVKPKTISAIVCRYSWKHI